MSDDEDDCCPLCMDELDLTDKSFSPCKCGYQVCLWCFHHIKENLNNQCPACRTPYEDGVNYSKPVDPSIMKRQKNEKKEKERKRREKLAQSRNHLQNVRVVQHTLVYVIGLPPSIAKADILRKHEYFGQYGKIMKVVVNRNHAYGSDSAHGPSFSAYITYFKREDAVAAIQAVDGYPIENRILRASFGTTKYCSYFLQGQSCTIPDCMYLHDLGGTEDSFTKEDLASGKVAQHVRSALKSTVQQPLPVSPKRPPAPRPPQPPATVSTTATTTTITTNSNNNGLPPPPERPESEDRPRTTSEPSQHTSKLSSPSEEQSPPQQWLSQDNGIDPACDVGPGFLSFCQPTSLDPEALLRPAPLSPVPTSPLLSLPLLQPTLNLDRPDAAPPILSLHSPPASSETNDSVEESGASLLARLFPTLDPSNYTNPQPSKRPQQPEPTHPSQYTHVAPPGFSYPSHSQSSESLDPMGRYRMYGGDYQAPPQPHAYHSHVQEDAMRFDLSWTHHLLEEDPGMYRSPMRGTRPYTSYDSHSSSLNGVNPHHDPHLAYVEMGGHVSHGMPSHIHSRMSHHRSDFDSGVPLSPSDDRRNDRTMKAPPGWSDPPVPHSPMSHHSHLAHLNPNHSAFGMFDPSGHNDMINGFEGLAINHNGYMKLQNDMGQSPHLYSSSLKPIPHGSSGLSSGLLHYPSNPGYHNHMSYTDPLHSFGATHGHAQSPTTHSRQVV